MKKIILLFTFYFLLFLNFPPALAQVSPTPLLTSPSDRLKEIKEKVEERLKETKEKLQKRAFWGTLKQIANSTLILDTPKGERRVKTTEETKIFLDKKPAKLADLAIGNFLIVMGTPEKNETLMAKRITAFSKPPTTAAKRQAIFGKVSDLSSEEKVLTVSHPKKTGIVYEVKVDAKTVITKKGEGLPAGEAGKIKKVNFEAIAIGDRIVAVAIKQKETSSFTAKIIHIIPGKATGLEKITPIPTTTGTISPTPTPKKPTPTPTE